MNRHLGADWWQLLSKLPLAAVLVQNGRVVQWNEAARTLYGYSAEQAVGMRLIDILLDATDERSVTQLSDVIASETYWLGDFRVRRADGVLLVTSFTLVPLEDTSGGSSIFAWLATDGVDHRLVEQQKEILMSAEHAARMSAEQWSGFLEAVLAATPVGIAVFDQELRCIKVNTALVEMDGGNPDQYLGRPATEHQGLTASIADSLEEVLELRQQILKSDSSISLAGGRVSERHFQFTFFPVLTAGGDLIGAGVTVVEVTETKRAEQERNRLLAQAAAATARLSVLAAATSVLTTSMEVEELINRLASVLVPRIASWCAIVVADPAGIVENVACQYQEGSLTEELRGLVGQDLGRGSQSEGLLARVVASGEAGFYVDVEAQEVFGSNQVGAATAKALSFPEGGGSVVVAPIQGRGRRLGALILGAARGRLNEEDLPLALEIAHRAALVLDNARVFGQERMVAETLQRALLPAELVSRPGVEIAARYLAGTAGVEVGGDWYDVVSLGSNVLLAIGDVVGHDIAAASSMGQLRTAIRAYAVEDPSQPEQILGRLRGLVETLDVAMASCFVASLDVETGKLVWANAGHPPPLCLDDNGAEFLGGDTGVMLGAPSDEPTSFAVKTMQPGSSLVFFTDGLVEVRGEDITYGLGRLRSAVANSSGLSAEELCQSVVESLLPSGRDRSDDVAVLVVRFLGCTRSNALDNPSG